MRSLATLAALIFSLQATLCGLRGFGVVESLEALAAPARPGSVRALASEPVRGNRPEHCRGGPSSPTPAERPGSPDEGRCHSHCQLYAEGIPSDAPQYSPPSVALHFAPALSQFGIHPVRALHAPTAFRAPPRARDLPILHAALLI